MQFEFMPEVQLLEEIKSESKWYRKCLGILALHTLKQGERDNIRGIKWKVSDTAELLGLSSGYISESIQLAKYLDRFRNQLDKMTRDMALKVIKEKDYSRGRLG